jgi:uncharacterized protein YhhL (DUF1145 family)
MMSPYLVLGAVNKLLNLVPMNFMVLMLSLEINLTGSKIKERRDFVPSLEQTQAGCFGGPIIKTSCFCFADVAVT